MAQAKILGVHANVIGKVGGTALGVKTPCRRVELGRAGIARSLVEFHRARDALT